MSLTNTQYNTIMRQYEERQAENRHVLAQRKEDAYRRCPRLRELEESIYTLFPYSTFS